MKRKPNLSYRALWNLSFGFYGIQLAYALESGNASRIFRTLGASKEAISYFWILPPLLGLFVQPIVGTLSDMTWCRFGRRIPYLFVGATLSVLILFLLPNAGSFGLPVATVVMLGILMLSLLDTSLNMSMQPFKMLVGDIVNEDQKAKAYSIQSLVCNTGSMTGFMLPFILTWIGVKNIAPEGVVPQSVIWSFYLGAIILISCVVFTFFKVKEWPPEEYLQYNPAPKSRKERGNWYVLLKNAPKTFWRVGLIQFFCWSAMLFMWTYVVDAISETVWHTTNPTDENYQIAANWTGVLYALQALFSVGWAAFLPNFRSTKRAYAVSIFLGALGFTLIPFMHNPYAQILPFMLIGCVWAAMLAMPFTFVTNALQGYGHMGAYLGLFNCTICLPQIIAALGGGSILKAVGGHQSTMMIVSGVLLFTGACCVGFLKENTRKTEA